MTTVVPRAAILALASGLASAEDAPSPAPGTRDQATMGEAAPSAMAASMDAMRTMEAAMADMPSTGTPMPTTSR